MAKNKEYLPLQPLRDVVLFPGLSITINVGREMSIAAVEAARLKFGNRILVVTQRDASLDGVPTEEDMCAVGVIGEIRRPPIAKDNTKQTYMVTIEGRRRVEIAPGSMEYDKDGGFLKMAYEDFPVPVSDECRCEALSMSIRDGLREYAGHVNPERRNVIMEILGVEDLEALAYCSASGVEMLPTDKQVLLESETVDGQLEQVCEAVLRNVEVYALKEKMERDVRDSFEKEHKKSLLREQIAVARRELGEAEDTLSMADEIVARGEAAGIPPKAMDRLRKEASKMAGMSVQSSEFTTLKSYLDLFVDLPWSTAGKSADPGHGITPKKVRSAMDKGHSGMDKPKMRIVEYLAVKAMSPEHRSPVLCFVGPPGVGKTSLAMSVASAIGRKACRVALGGVHDEAEIRGHRRTYVGAMPGKIIQTLSRCGSGSPVMVLDEIDKMGSDFKGDPSAAMLEVLDPAQNHTFMDHYVDHEFDLSGVMFIATANSLEGIPGPLMDRMEIIHIDGYLETEKMSIATGHLIPRAMKDHGLDKGNFSFPKARLKTLIRRYTMEAGVRSLEQRISAICRKSVVRILEGEKKVKIDEKTMVDMLGAYRYDFGRAEEADQIGVTMGLAWTSVGGDVLTVEAAVMQGSGKVKATGKLGEVMQESAQTAMSFVRSVAPCLSLPADFHKKVDIHIHVPEGATPKDGPSAGVTIATSLVSALLSIPVRKDVAMTGEITLRGRVLPIGGLREKLLAAQRAGIKKVFIPEVNKKDLAEVPADILEKLEIVPVKDGLDVISKALVGDNVVCQAGRFKSPFWSGKDA